ncbi:hypothetical protein GF358_02005 [Candidatus Woesearchaeota archaeon]|nr:hypothetical protein [Candidatus Woesearchaeota archaeon]
MIRDFTSESGTKYLLQNEDHFKTVYSLVTSWLDQLRIICPTTLTDQINNLEAIAEQFKKDVLKGDVFRTIIDAHNLPVKLNALKRDASRTHPENFPKRQEFYNAMLKINQGPIKLLQNTMHPLYQEFTEYLISCLKPYKKHQKSDDQCQN